MSRERRLSRTGLASVALGALITLPAVARGDVFDPGDNSSTTENELIHRSEQLHDLAAPTGQADVDWYRISERPFKSYEVVVDQTSGDIGPIVMDLIESDGATVVMSSQPVSSLGLSRTLRWEWEFVPGQTPVAHERYVRVRSGGCTTTCDATSVYRIRAFETTYTIPRYYDAGSTFTILVLQNPTDQPAVVHIYYWRALDASLIEAANTTYTIPALSLKVIPPNPVLTGLPGNITITSPSGYGELRGKASQFDSDPVHPQAWDHPMAPRP
jgi:hypothetical protein